ncbi:MAG TPA: hypothetical protein DCO90_18880, partial [Sphingobacterium sp.]|nr:hypothetical protein [Sphingobacterium sp.]
RSLLDPLNSFKTSQSIFQNHFDSEISANKFQSRGNRLQIYLFYFLIYNSALVTKYFQAIFNVTPNKSLRLNIKF